MTVWPRIGPFVDGLFAEDMPKFAIRIGCESSQIGFHPQFFDLVGLENITLIDSESPVFAKEVIAPTEGFSHSPLLNYWNLVAMRQNVFSHLGPIEKPTNKTVLVIIRDALHTAKIKLSVKCLTSFDVTRPSGRTSNRHGMLHLVHCSSALLR